MTEVYTGSAEPCRDDVSTSDPELAAEVLRDSYRVRGGVRISDVAEGFRFFHERLSGAGFAVTRFRADATVCLQGPLDGLLCVERVHAGHLSIDTASGDRRTTGPGEVGLIPPHESWLATAREIDLAPIVLERDRVATHAASLCDIEPDALTFTGLRPSSRAAANHWDATVAHVRDDVLCNPGVVTSPLVQFETFRLLATGLLALFPNNAVVALDDRPVGRSRRAAPATIRRAVAYIDANAQRPIGLADIAGAARIGARGLQYNFRRYRGCTPLDYLRQVRLAGAHQDLVAGDPTRGDTVTAIAARWGFSNPGRFSVEYRREYGCSPSESLRS